MSAIIKHALLVLLFVASVQSLLDAGYGYSVLDEPRADEKFDLESFREMFRDWGWAGKLGPITISSVPGTIEITRAGARRLLDLLLSSEITSASFAYLLNALLISDNFRWVSESVRDSMEAVLNIENERDVDSQRAWRAREELSSR